MFTGVQTTGGAKAATGKQAGTLPKTYEQGLWDKGFYSVAGVDEAGRGPLAGPVRSHTAPASTMRATAWPPLLRGLS